MGIENCRECGKPVSTEAKTCPSCGARKPTKTTNKTRWGMIVLVVLAIGIFSRGFSGNKTLDEQTAARPECQVKMANGVFAESRCDLMTLCIARQKAGTEYDDALKRYKDKIWLDDKLDEQIAKIDALSVKLQRYTKDDLQKWCGLKGEVLGPFADRIRNASALTASSVQGGNCNQSPITALPMGQQMNSGELAKLLNATCPGASLGSDQTVTVRWDGKQYQLFARKLPNDSAGAQQYEITSIKAVK